MKSTLFKFLSVTAIALAVTAASAADVGISVQIGQPGFYGRIDLGNAYPQPQLLYPQPVIVQRVVGVRPEPVYLRVPPGHAKNWHKHCGAYNACGQPVYFVQENWYNNVYVPEYRQRRGDDQGDRDGDRGRGHGKGKGKGHKHDD
jgi:hypothetical protein